MSSERSTLITARPPGLVDVLDRILDKGLVIAGDIKVSLANVELLTLQIRLLVCSIDKAEQIGLNWWRYDTNLTTRAERAEAENLELRERLSELESEIRKLSAAAAVSGSELVATKRGTTRKTTKKRRSWTGLHDEQDVMRTRGAVKSSRKQYAGFSKLKKRNRSKWLSKEHQAVLV